MGSQHSISSFGASLNSLYGAKNTPSKNSMLIGIAVEDKLKDKTYAPEHYENLAKMLVSKLTGEELLTARDSYLENKTEKDIKFLKHNPTLRSIARDVEINAIEIIIALNKTLSIYFTIGNGELIDTKI